MLPKSVKEMSFKKVFWDFWLIKSSDNIETIFWHDQDG